jgi:hypothetical protein
LSRVDLALTVIKNLEDWGQLNLPEPHATVGVGSIDAAAGAFFWTVPTFTQTFVTPYTCPIFSIHGFGVADRGVKAVSFANLHSL